MYQGEHFYLLLVFLAFDVGERCNVYIYKDCFMHFYIRYHKSSKLIWKQINTSKQCNIFLWAWNLKAWIHYVAFLNHTLNCHHHLCVCLQLLNTWCHLSTGNFDFYIKTHFVVFKSCCTGDKYEIIFNNMLLLNKWIIRT